jgi:Double zinc ribbon
MRCSICGYENHDAAKFCHECSAPLLLSCPACGVTNRVPAKFRTQCGVPPADSPLRPAPRSRSPAERIEPVRPLDPAIVKGERRHLTALFRGWVRVGFC